MADYRAQFAQKAHLFQQLGYDRPEALLLHLPLRYEYHVAVTHLKEATVGMTIACDVCITAVQKTPRGRGRYLLICTAQDQQGHPLRLRFLHAYPSDCTRLTVGKRYRVTGLLRYAAHQMEIIHPKYESLSTHTPTPTPQLIPIYHTVAGLTQNKIRSIITDMLSQVSPPDILPLAFCQQYQQPLLSETIRQLHIPPTSCVPHITALNDKTHPLWHRIKWEELLAYYLCLRAARHDLTQPGAPILCAHIQQETAFLQQLPFTLTDAQQQCYQDIARDLSSGYYMHRLLQGDVGSGKTVVAALTALIALSHQKQVAYMTPTELLSRQIYQHFTQWFAPFQYRVALLIADLPAREKKKIRAGIAEGTYDCIIGTHSLIQDTTQFADLALIIIDEQHRFGVKQRLSLRKKSAAPVHQLMMSATPIPRSLAMTVYADLAISSMYGKPHHRMPTQTAIMSTDKKSALIDRIGQTATPTNQVYWVCPLIEESEEIDLTAAKETYDQLQTALPHLRILFLHGQLKTDIKNQLMDRFLAGEAEVLVSTTVIEVGIHVDTANIMIIEHAERFGLTQLHQLRGRVGRGRSPGKCVLLYRPPLSAKAMERLRIIQQHEDGFRIAEEDLAMRGSGSVVSEKQSGAHTLRFASFPDDLAIFSHMEKTAQALDHYPETITALQTFWFAGEKEYPQA